MLMRSVSGVRGIVGVDLTPEVVLRHAAAFGTVLRGGTVVVARDTRPTGPMIQQAAVAGLLSVGCDVIDIGVAPTPTVPLAVSHYRARAGLAITASHNPIEWNALKFLGTAERILAPRILENTYRRADEQGSPSTQKWNQVGRYETREDAMDLHIGRILGLPVVDTAAIRRRRPKVVFDAGGGAGSVFGPALLERLGCHAKRLFCDPDGTFPRGTEPIPKNLKALGQAVQRFRADLGFACDPDGDRLAIVDENGRPLGEERTLVLATYWVLSKTPGPVVINLSTSRAVLDVASGYGQAGYTSKVGELNVALMMKSKRAVLGGEGNGGVIMPALHPGRDALLGMALVLSLRAHSQAPISQIDSALPRYFAAKKTVAKPPNWADRLKRFADYYIKEHMDDRDGIKVGLPNGSIHARPSNTEPIVRISSEAKSMKRARELLKDGMQILGFDS